jgi:hypothetical protein
MKEESIIEHESNDFEFDEVRGEHGRKPKMAVLNKTKLSKYELDDLFASDEPQTEAVTDDI